MSQHPSPDQQGHGRKIGSFLAADVVKADIGTSLYYVAGLMFLLVGRQAPAFVALTYVVFVLLAWRYSKITVRFKHGGGVVAVAGEAFGKWAGAIGGNLISIDYWLTMAISAASAVAYVHSLIPEIPMVTGTILVIVAIGGLNLLGVKESARVTSVFVTISSMIMMALMYTVITHMDRIAWWQVLTGFSFTGLTAIQFGRAYGGSFLAFSGLESIAQLAPAIEEPREKTARNAMWNVAIYIAMTSPLLTAFATNLLPASLLADEKNTEYTMSLLARFFGGHLLEISVVASAACMLVFAVNTGCLGQYHVQGALVHSGFLPKFLEARLSTGAPWLSILIAIAVPIVLVICVQANVKLLGDMYAFGLMGCLFLSSLGMDVLAWRENVNKKITWEIGLGWTTTFLVGIGFVINLFEKPMATQLGLTLLAILTGLMVVTRFTTDREGFMEDLSYLRKLIPAWQPEPYQPNLGALTADPNSENQHQS